jgi:ribose transport system ATP-binding protein
MARRPVLEVGGLSKTFPGQRALDDVDLTVRAGEVHALLGQNGSGKSTLIKVLAGYHAPDPGASILVDGEPLPAGALGAGHQLGLRFVHQDLGLVPALNVIDNLALTRGYRTNAFGKIDWRAEADLAARALADIGLDVDPFATVESLSLAERAGVAVARAVHDDERGTTVLVLDEPTAALPANEVDHLFAVLRRLRDRGVGIVLVSHHLDEVLAIADRVSVLRDGRRVATVPRDQLDHDHLVQLIVGREVSAGPARSAAMAGTDTDDRETCLRAVAVAGANVREFSLDLAVGEVVGLAGLDGSGRESIIRLLAGQSTRAAGSVVVGHTPVPPGSPARALRAGMAYVPSDRASDGVFAALTVRENLTIARLRHLRRLGRVQRRAELAETRRWMERLHVVASGTEAPVATLSGGNQQKVMLGRSLRLQPAVLLLDEPTRGVDIGARNEVHGIIERAVADGMGVLVASTDTDELIRLCDRVLIMQGGLVVRALHRDHDLAVDAVDHAQVSRPLKEAS